mgnify:CR=1 FL=1
MATLSNIENAQLMLEAKFFKGLADKSRLSILEALMDGEKAVSEIVESTGLTQSNASMHLACLLDCGLVARTRDGQRMNYRLADDEVKDLIAIMRKLVTQHAQEIFDCTHNYDHKIQENEKE